MSDPVISRADAGYRLDAGLVVWRPIEDVFPFFADAGNLERITPARLHFRILTPRPIEMKEGTLIDYALRIRGMPVRWQSEITCWEPPHRFVDEQRHGPYRWWIHEHDFRARGDATAVCDRVCYGVPGGGLAHQLFVKRNLRAIFRHRASVIAGLLNA